MEDNNGFDYEELEIARFFSNKMFDKLMDMRDDDFLDYILKNGADSDYVLENFKPWSITNKIKKMDGSQLINKRRLYLMCIVTGNMV